MNAHESSAHESNARERRRANMLRIAMISPYSLTIPGGVQHQVLGLAR